MLSFRRRGFSTTRSPSPGAVSADGRLVTVIDTSNPPSQWQLPSGHFVSAKQAMMRIYPLADASTSTNARHRWAYYDGSTPIQYRVPLGVAFGSFPYHYEVLIGPAGLSVGASYGDTDYGIVTWTPTGSVSGATVTIRVTDQEGNTLNITWTVSTSSATSRFVFVDAANGNNTNSGAIGSPKQTLANVFGSTFAASANAGAIVYLRSGTYTMPSYTDNSINSSYTCFQWSCTTKPCALIGYPGETATLNASTGRIVLPTEAAGAFLQNLTFSGAMNTNNMRLFWIWSEYNCFDALTWINAGAGTVADDNATMFFTGDDPVQKNYLYINDCHERGRNDQRANSYGFCSTYARRYMLIERCSFIGSAADGMYIKGNCQDVTVRCCSVELNNDGYHVLANGFQAHARIEICYCKLKSLDGTSRHLADPAGTITNFWFYRNSLYRTGVDGVSISGTAAVENCAIATNSTPRVGASFTNTGAECQGTVAAGIMDSSTLALTGSYRTNYLGRRGHEISA